MNKGHPAWNKGLKGWTKGTKAGFQKGHPSYTSKMSEESKKEMSKARQGKDNPNWRGGKIKYICSRM